MQALIDTITSKVSGVSAEQAKSVVDSVLEFVKTKVPHPVATQLESVLNGNEFSMTEILKEEATEKLENLKDVAAEKFEDLKEAGKNLMDKIGL
jgi:LPS O-antigen subunit length determinant protein (WzzB/FepE family)